MGNEGECQCDSCKYADLAPICGILGNETVTAPSFCLLKRQACMNNKPYTVLHRGKCEGKSGTSLIKKFFNDFLWNFYFILKMEQTKNP